MSWMITAVVGSIVLKAASDNASQTSAKANGGQDVSGGGLGKLGSAVGAAAGAMGGGDTSVPYSFYGGESAGQLKSASKLKVVGGVNPDRTSKGDVFYSNVHIPRKKV